MKNKKLRNRIAGGLVGLGLVGCASSYRSVELSSSIQDHVLTITHNTRKARAFFEYGGKRIEIPRGGLDISGLIDNLESFGVSLYEGCNRIKSESYLLKSEDELRRWTPDFEHFNF